jgi:hypothetical protein
LNLEVTGSIDPVKDIEPLQRQKLRILATQRSANTNDYAAGLRVLYAEALPRLAPPSPPATKFSSNISNLTGPGVKPKPLAGSQAKQAAANLSIEEIERQYLPLVELTPADYRQLTGARVQSIVSYLKAKAQIADDRLFIATNPNTPVLKEGARVVFGLQ